MERKLKDILNDLDNGILPAELDFSQKQNEEQIDINKIKYNAFYRDYNYFDKKFNGLQNYPGYDDYINYLVENSKTPLEQLEEIKKENVTISNNE
jgi:hypothetical protein